VSHNDISSNSDVEGQNRHSHLTEQTFTSHSTDIHIPQNRHSYPSEQTFISHRTDIHIPLMACPDVPPKQLFINNGTRGITEQRQSRTKTRLENRDRKQLKY
jgi:hypothetical protein